MMKRNTLTYWVCTLLLSVCALPCLAQNRIEMYTYFPVPYVAYNNIFMVGTAEEPAEFQVGFTNNFALNLGSENKPSLTAHTVTLKPSNTLTFNTDVYTGTATFGTANTEGDAPYDAAALTFNNNLRVRQLTETVSNGPDEEHGKVVEKITANNKVTVKGRVAMNTSAFTSAAAAQLPDCSDGDGKVRWSELTFDGKTKYFLTCGYTDTGSGVEPECLSVPHHWEWQLAEGNLLCATQAMPTATYQTLLEACGRNENSLPMLAGCDENGNYAGIVSYSQCRANDGTEWHYESKDSVDNRLYFTAGVSTFYNGNTLCVPGGNPRAHDPGEGRTCLDIEITNGHGLMLPYCSNGSFTPGESGSDWGSGIYCADSITIPWYQADNQSSGLVRLYKSVCVPD